MSALRELQRDFAQALISSHDATFASCLSSAYSPERFHLYRLTVAGILGKALESVYPVCARLVGARCFDGLARRYLRDAPSQSGDLHELGETFADFLAATPLVAALPYLPEVARLEWAYHRVFHAADSPALDTQGLSETDPAEYGALCFKLTPACRLLSASFPIHRIWAANQPVEDGALTIAQEDTWLLLQRRADAIELLPLAHGVYVFLHSLQASQPLAAAMAAALEADSAFNPNVILPRMVKRAVLVDFFPSTIESTLEETAP